MTSLCFSLFSSLSLADSQEISGVSELVLDFSDPSVLRDWGVVNDSVMGGVSRSSVRRTDEGNLRFSGILSLENNGGFASARSRARLLGFEGASGVTLSVRGDGRTYYLDLRSRSQSMAGSYRAAFETVEGAWTKVYLPFDGFVRQSFGRRLPGSVDPGRIDSIGFTLSDKQPGAFQLEVASVERVFSEGESGSQGFEAAPIEPTTSRELIEFAISRGVPLFNEGNHRACADIYEMACRALTAMPELSERGMEIVGTALRRIESESAFESAWTLRYALDEVMELLPEPTSGSDV
ncbi:CIA30 family protein [Pelagicoccus mobilis]|uniref:CIA30 family protein n=1 Tax=Pelagicoccus mobilis TaxID=415221 RepID=A0A934VPX1_9BACT|nr:CIA30 family protein [Pelagicoccus mobilis]MBK1876275.1 CIA30 family protein [Pelagicoccus mobilis]